MATRGLTILVLLATALPASAEKVAYLLDQSGQVTAHMEIYGQGQDSNTYTYDFSDAGPFFPHKGGGFTSDYIRSGNEIGTELDTSYEIGESGAGCFLVDFGNHEDGGLPFSGYSSISLHWRFQVGDEPLSISMANYDLYGRPGGMTNILTDENANQTLAAPMTDQPQYYLFNLQAGHIYDWEVNVSSSDWQSATFTSYLNFEDGQLVPEPSILAILFPGFAFLAMIRGKRKSALAVALIGSFVFIASEAYAYQWTLYPDGSGGAIVKDEANNTVPGKHSLKNVVESRMPGAGDVVLVKPGTYNASTINWPDANNPPGSAPLHGDPNNPIIIEGDDTDPNNLPLFETTGSRYWMYFQSNSYITVKNLRVDGVERPFWNGREVNKDGAYNIVIDKCQITNCLVPGTTNTAYAISFTEPDGYPDNANPPHDITITNCVIQNVAGVGIKFHGRAHDITIDAVIIDTVYDQYSAEDDNNDDDGITFTYDSHGAPYNLTVSNVAVSHVGEDGIDIKAFGGVTITNCTISDANCDGVKLWSPIVDEANNIYRQGSFVLRNVTVRDAGQVACEAFYMPKVDIEQCSLWGGEQGLLYNWESDPIPSFWLDANGNVANTPLSSTLRSYRNMFATKCMDSSYPACEIVKSKTTGSNTVSISFVTSDPNDPNDPRNIDNDAFWIGSDPNCADDPNNCDANNTLLQVHAYGVDGNFYKRSNISACSIYGQLGIEFSPFVSKSMPPYSPAADFNLDGVVDGNDYDVWRTAVKDGNYASNIPGTKRTGDANRDGIVDAYDFEIWDHTISPVYHTGDFTEDGNMTYDDYGRWRSGYGLQLEANHYNGDADGDGDIDKRDFWIMDSTFALVTNHGLRYSPPADFNGDFVVDGTDYNIWQQNYLHGAPGPARR